MAKHGFVKVVVLGGAVEVRWRCGCKYVNEVGVLGGALEVHCLRCAGGAVGVHWRCSWGALEVQWSFSVLSVYPSSGISV